MGDEEEHQVVQPAPVQAPEIQMAQSVAIQPMPVFHPEAEVGASLATRWKNWNADFDMFIIASGIIDPKRKRALLLYQAGPRIREIFKQIPDTGNDDDYEKAKDKLREHFEPQKNRRYEVYRFRKATQESQETLDQFHTRLRSLAETCEFADVEFEIEQQIIIGGTSSKIRKNALRDPNYDLKAMLLEGRRDEQSTFQAKEIEGKEEHFAEANKLKSTSKQKKCHQCGGPFPHDKVCPAKGKDCLKCGKKNHFANKCRSKGNRQQVQQNKGRKPILHPLDHDTPSQHSDEDYLYGIHHEHTKSPQINVKVCGHSFKMVVDTGATINVIDQETFAKMGNVKLQSTQTKAFAYDCTKPVQFSGKFNAAIETKKRFTVATLYVVKGSNNSGNLMSLSTAKDLGLISLHINQVKTKDGSIDNILQKHSKVFDGLGKLKDTKISLSIDVNKAPKVQPQRRIPYHVRQKVKTALKELEEQDIIEKVPDNEGTPWVSPIVVVPKKDGGVRICVDMRLANEAIQRTRHPIPTVDDVRFELNGAKFFTKLDLSQAYHQLELDEASRSITTFSTHLGLYRYKRLNYGTNAAAEIFQYTLQTQLQGLKCVKNIADDIIVFGQTREEP